MLLLFN